MSVALLSNNPLLASLHNLGKIWQPFGSGLQSFTGCPSVMRR
jgi:hypothetical protein